MGRQASTARALNLVVSTQQEGQTRLQGLCAGNQSGATSQAFHEPMSTGAFLEFLTRLGCQGSGACWPGLQGLGAEMLERRREPCLSCDCKAPPSETIQCPPRSADWGRTHEFALQEVKNSVCSKSTGERGGIQAPGACGPGLAFSLFANLLRGCRLTAASVGTWRETKPGYPPPLPHPPPAFWGCKGEKEGFHPLRLRQPSNTPPKGRRILMSSRDPPNQKQKQLQTS